MIVTKPQVRIRIFVHVKAAIPGRYHHGIEKQNKWTNNLEIINIPNKLSSVYIEIQWLQLCYV